MKDVLYLRNPSGRGNTPSSRNLGLRHASGHIVAFLDDDAFVHHQWAERLLAAFRDPVVAAVAGRALNGVSGEEAFGIDEIGQISKTGMVKGFFAANPNRVIEVDHGIGCNMAFRSSVIAALGGFRDDFKFGPFGICEETDIFVRAKRLGYRFFFDPEICVDHIAAPQPGGRRFSPKYSYYHSRNVIVMHIRNSGWAGIAWKHVGASTVDTVKTFLRKQAGAFAHLIFALGGLMSGMVIGTLLLFTSGRDPIRRDGDYEEIRMALSSHTHSDQSDQIIERRECD